MRHAVTFSERELSILTVALQLLNSRIDGSGSLFGQTSRQEMKMLREKLTLPGDAQIATDELEVLIERIGRKKPRTLVAGIPATKSSGRNSGH